MDELQCKNEGVISELKTEVKQIWMQINKMNGIYKTLQTLSENTAVLAEQMKNTNQEIKAVKEDVRELKSMPGKNYNSIKIGVTMAIIGGFLGYIINQILG